MGAIAWLIPLQKAKNSTSWYLPDASLKFFGSVAFNLESIQGGKGVEVIIMVGEGIELIVVDADGEAGIRFTFSVSVSEAFKDGVCIAG